MKNKYFEEGDYIVITNKPSNVPSSVISASFPLNFIFKQKITCGYLMSEVDSSGSTTNGFTCYDSNNPWNWRYAEPHEIKEYEIKQFPFDVTVLKISADNFSII